MRRSRIGRPSVSASSPPRNAGAGALKAPPATMGMTFVGMGVYPEDHTAAPARHRDGFPLVSRYFPGLGAVSGLFGPAASPFCWKSRCCAVLFGSTWPCWGLAPSFFSSCDALWPALAGDVLACGVVGVFVCD